MPDAVRPKVGIIACSGEELPEGTITRQALLKVMDELRPGRITSLCLPLFLAGDEGHRGFARRHPTIALDGCQLRCAARATETYSAAPGASIVVSDLIREHGLASPRQRRRLDEAGRQAVDVTAARLATVVDQMLGEDTALPQVDVAPAELDDGAIACSCGSGIRVTRLPIDGATVEVVALPLILRRFHEAGRLPDEGLARELLEAVKIYNLVPPEAEQAWCDALLHEYRQAASR